MITLHLKLQNEYLKLNDYIENGNITWGKNGDDGVSVNLKNVPNGKNLLADSLGQELVAYRGGELAWKGFVSNVTENENGIELVGRGDFHKLDYIEDFGKFYIQNTFENWGSANLSNTVFYPDLTVTSGSVIWMRAEDLSGNAVHKWYDKTQSGVEFTEGPGAISNPLTTYTSAYVEQINGLSSLKIQNSSDVSPNYQIATYLSTSTTYPSSTSHEFYFVLDTLDGDGSGQYPEAPLMKYGPFEFNATTDFTIVPYQYAKLQLVIRTTGSPVTVDLGYPDRVVNRTVLRIKVLTGNSVIEVYKDFQLLTTVDLGAGTIDTSDTVIRFGNYSYSSIFNTLTRSYVYEFISYARNLSADELTTADKYFDEKYKTGLYSPSSFESVIVTNNVNPVEFTPSFESQAYISLQNGDTFSLNDTYMTYFKVPESSETGVNTSFFNLEYRIPSGFSVDVFYYSDDLEYTRLYQDSGTLVSGVVERSTRTINFNSSNNVRQLNLGLTYAPFNSTLSPLTYTNTASNDYYYVKLTNFVASNLQLQSSGRLRLSEASLSLDNGRVLYTTLKNNSIRVGSIVGFGSNVTTIGSYAYVESVNVVTKSSVDYTEFTCNNSIARSANSAFFVFTSTTADVITDIANEYLNSSTIIVEEQNDLLLNKVYKDENLKNAVQELADSLNCRVYKQGDVMFFIKNPVNLYYLNQSSKSISQSFDKFYNRVRGSYNSIYELENYTSYADKPSKWSIRKSKTINLGTSAAGLATEIARTVLDEDIASVVKVIPQTGDLYNEYGAVVRDPKINSAVVLKNVVPELIGLGDKTYYLSQIKYDFATGKYEYVIDEPELTFELILERANG